MKTVKPDKKLQAQQAALAQQQSDLLAQQETEKAQVRKKAQRQSIDMMRARFGSISSSGSSSGGLGLANPTPDTAANLFTRLTGR